MLSLDTEKLSPPRILIYGVEGIGKTTFGVKADDPVFIPIEKGLSGIAGVKKYPVAQDFQQVMSYITELATKDHDRKTLVLDSLDWLEPLVWNQVCREANVKNIEDVDKGFGKGYIRALDVWREYLTALDYLNAEKNMTIIQIAHAAVKRFDNPETESYDRYSIKLQDGKSCTAAGLLFEYSDIVLFANYYVGVTKNSEDKNDKRKRAVGSGERILYTQEKPSAKAKNRFGLPPEIPFDQDGAYWNILKQHIPYFQQQNGVKNNG